MIVLAAGCGTAILAIALLAFFADSPAATVKELDNVVPCKECGRPTWSANELCIECRPDGPGRKAGGRIIDRAYLSRRVLPVQVGENGRIVEPLPCPECEYNLQTIPLDAACPECGLAIEPALSNQPLSLAPARFVKHLKAGAFLILLSIALYLIMIAVFAATLMFMPIGVALALFSASIIALGCMVIGMFRISASEPGVPRNSTGEIAARWARHGTMIVLGAIVAHFVLQTVFVNPALHVIVEFATTIGWMVAVTGLVYRLHALTPRLRSGASALGLPLLRRLMIPVCAAFLFVVFISFFLEPLHEERVVARILFVSIFLGVYLCITIIGCWLIVILAYRYVDFRYAHRLASRRIDHVLSTLEQFQPDGSNASKTADSATE